MSENLGELVRKQLLALPTKVRLAALRQMGDEKCDELLHDWPFWAREKQLWRDEWPEPVTLWRTGRAFGKTRCGAETVHMWARDPERWGGEILLLGQTNTAIRSIMIEGKSGIIATAKPGFEPDYQPTKMRVVWPNGFIAHIRSSEKPDLIRGLSVGGVWGDEWAHYFDPEECWDQVKLATREGRRIKIIVTTTPIPTKFIRNLSKHKKTRLITGSSHENRENLAEGFLEDIDEAYGGSARGRQEIDGDIVEDNENANFKTEHIQRIPRDDVPKFVHLAVGVDPAGGEASAKGDETGIIGMAIDEPGNLYVLADRSKDESSHRWSISATKLALILRAEFNIETPVYVVGEINFGGDLVKTACERAPDWKGSGLRFEMVRAVGSKSTRADPIGQHSEMHRYYHVGEGTRYRKLENQMTQWDPDLPRTKQDSPDRMDAMVHVATFLLDLWARTAGQMAKISREQAERIRRSMASRFQ